MWLATAAAAATYAPAKRRFCPTERELIDFLEEHKDLPVTVEWIEIQPPLSPEEKTESQIRKELFKKPKGAPVPLGRSGETE